MHQLHKQVTSICSEVYIWEKPLRPKKMNLCSYCQRPLPPPPPPPLFFCRDILQICDKLLNFADFAVLYTYMANIDKFARGIFAPSFDTTPTPAVPSKNSSDLVVDGFHIVIWNLCDLEN